MACRWIDPQKKKKENLHLDRQVCREFELWAVEGSTRSSKHEISHANSPGNSRDHCYIELTASFPAGVTARGGQGG